MIEAVKITTDIILEIKKIVGRSKHSNKRGSKKCYVLMEKRHIIDKKHIAPIDFVDYLRKSDVLENSEIYFGRFVPNRFHERYCYISKSR